MTPSVLFVNHASRLSGAELVLLDIAQAFRGASAFLFEDGPLCAALAKAGVTPILPAGASGFTSIKRDRSLWRALPHMGGLARMLLRLRSVARGFDLIYANSQKAFALAAPACAAARRPLIWHLHDILSSDHFGRGQIGLTVRLANRFASRVIVPSRAAAEAFTAAGGHQPLIRVVPNGLDDASGPDLEPLRAAFGLTTPFVFGVFSRLSPWKGQSVALKALAELPDAGCVIAGAALFGEEAYAEALLAEAASLGVADRVRFLGQRSDVPALMRAVDAVVHPSTEPEPFGRTLVEAMLARRPLIAADAGAVPEILDGGRVGLLFPPGDHAALAERLRAVRGGAGLELLDLAEQRAREFYNAARMRDAIRAVVAEAAAA
jgi:glycosyltransferase involved in cell wall biosynthesis